MFFQKYKSKHRRKSLSKEAKKKIRNFLIKQQKRNEKMIFGNDTLDFRKAAQTYDRAILDFDCGDYRSAKKILRGEVQEMKNIACVFGKRIAKEGGLKHILHFVKELFAM